MRKLAVAAILVLSLIIGAIGYAVAAQDATPAPESSGIEGATVEDIFEVESESGTLGMSLYQIRLDPGVEVDAHDHYGSVTWYIDSGTLELTVEDGEVWVRCAGDCLAGAEPEHVADDGSMLVPDGATVTLGTGDWAIQHDFSRHMYANPGDTETVVVASTSYDTASPPGATPASGPPIRPQSCKGACL